MVVTYITNDADYYPSAEAYLQESDLIEIDIYIVGMKGKFRIRSLTFQQMSEITQKAMDSNGVLDDTKFVLNTWLHGVIRPVFNEAQVSLLLSKNGEIVKEVSDQIWRLGRVTKATFDAYIAELEEASKAANKTDASA